MCHDSAMQPVKDPCSLGTHSHSSKKYIKVFVHRTYALVNGQIKGDPLLLQPVSEPCGGYCIIHTVVYIKLHGVLLTNTAPSHICFVCDDKRRIPHDDAC